jgi:hypothetical protein
MSSQNPGADIGSQSLNESPAQRGAFFFADFIRSDQPLIVPVMANIARLDAGMVCFRNNGRMQASSSWPVMIDAKLFVDSRCSGRTDIKTMVDHFRVWTRAAWLLDVRRRLIRAC